MLLASTGTVSQFQAEMLLSDYDLVFFNVDFTTGDINMIYASRKDREIKINYVLHVKKNKEEGRSE